MRSYYGLDALAAGVSLAPTSIGIALKLLLESEYLETVVGQAIIAAAFFDDILSHEMDAPLNGAPLNGALNRAPLNVLH